ncbi:Coenzyme F420 hydrogenase/dehydrogenase, beta subunit C-terminal domain [Bacillus sinesaloumensis]|uniref:Coenzyme F420 hydrogenase/dehydrogenase, beta subunit C-terminal domain n=1 Tax=Litchfieldia sinesaloumensis TaxID=1926280 RepID=UPI00098868BA|nr:Coenzyme F420 hydrogenase/dehydrogenase, beta subunit C-terminal domain [Bacillus sinesaloumensis]
MSKDNIISKVIDANMCSGCGICAGIVSNEKISMQFSEDGYLRPVINKSITEEENNILSQVCPGNVVNYDRVPTNEPVWGNIESSTIAYSTDENIRHKGSSGGVLSQLLVYLLEKGEVDEIIHIGVSNENPLLNEIKRSNTKEQVLQNSGSRYSPSAPLANLGKLLNENKKFALVGKPCDIAALRSYSRLDERVSEKILYFFSFFCAGVPSIEGTYKILENFNVKKEEVQSFRYRGEGWPGLTEVITSKNEKFNMKYDDSWGKILNRHLQPRCKVCIDGIGEFADISCGDGWFGNENGYPSFEESKGRSLVTTRTVKGQDLFERAVKEGHLSVDQSVSIEEIEKIQPYQSERRRLLLSRIIAMKVSRRRTPGYPKSLLVKSSQKISFKKKAKSFLGTTIRIKQGKM